MERALDGLLSVALMPASACAPPPLAKGGGGRGELWWAPVSPPSAWEGHTPPLRATAACKRAASPSPPPAVRAPASLGARDSGLCRVHSAEVCVNCRRLRRTAGECCELGPHEAGHVPRRPAIETCEDHRLPACESCALGCRGLRHCCPWHHPRPRPPAVPASKRPRLAPRVRAPPRAPHTPPLQPPAAKRPRLGLPLGL